MPSHTIMDIRKALMRTCHDPRVNRIVLFGSHAKGTAGAKSDIDLFLDSGKMITGFDFFDLKAAFEEALDAEIDLLSDRDVMPGSPVEREILKHGVTVYGE